MIDPLLASFSLVGAGFAVIAVFLALRMRRTTHRVVIDSSPLSR